MEEMEMMMEDHEEQARSTFWTTFPPPIFTGFLSVSWFLYSMLPPLDLTLFSIYIETLGKDAYVR
jgi:hypothetical protein